MTITSCSYQKYDSDYTMLLFDQNQDILHQKMEALRELHDGNVLFNTSETENLPSVKLTQELKTYRYTDKEMKEFDEEYKVISEHSPILTDVVKVYLESKKSRYDALPAHFSSHVFCDLEKKHVRFFSYKEFECLANCSQSKALFGLNTSIRFISIYEEGFTLIDEQSLTVYSAKFIDPWKPSDYLNYLLADSGYFVDPSIQGDDGAFYVRSSVLNQILFPANPKAFIL